MNCYCSRYVPISGIVEVTTGTFEYMTKIVRAINSALKRFANSLLLLSVYGSQNVIKLNNALPEEETDLKMNTICTNRHIFIYILKTVWKFYCLYID